MSSEQSRQFGAYAKELIIDKGLWIFFLYFEALKMLKLFLFLSGRIVKKLIWQQTHFEVHLPTKK